MVEITYQMVLSTLQTIALIVGIAYYLIIMRNSQRNQNIQIETRQTQLFMQIYEKLNSEESMKSWAELVNQQVPDYDEFLQKYDSSVNPAHYAKRARIWYTYNSIGELLRMGTIKPELLTRLKLDTQVIAMWDKWEPIILETRERENVPDNWQGFEYLYNEMKNLRESRGYPAMTLHYLDRSS